MTSWTDEVDEVIDLRGAIGLLTVQERRVMCLYSGYLTQREIAACLGISQVRVNELLAHAKVKIRALATYQNPPETIHGLLED